jgi:hypothetical protein
MLQNINDYSGLNDRIMDDFVFFFVYFCISWIFPKDIKFKR